MSVFFCAGPMYYLWNLQVRNSIKVKLKLDPTVLFIYLKIILLQCFSFQFSAISSIQTNPKFKLLLYIFLDISVHLHATFSTLHLCLRFWLGPTALFITQPNTQKHAYPYISRCHSNIHTFKNYFATVFSIISF